MYPLEHITIVSLEQAVAAPLASRHLADLGARVVKVERPGVGDFAREYDRTVHGDASYFVWLNRGKESIELDIKDPENRAVLDALIAKADVVLQNLVPGAVERLGLDAATLRAGRPELIHCSISGYGDGGPYQTKKAYDLLVQCETGLVSVTGSAGEPAKVGISVGDIATGMYAYSGILTALYERERTRQGSTIAVSLLDALGEWMMQPVYHSVYGGGPPRRTGARHPSISPYGRYTAGDGAIVYLGIQNDREWARLCRDVIERPELVDDPRFARNSERVEHDTELTSIIEAAFAGTTADALVAQLDEIGIACGRLRTPAEFFAHPQIEARDRWRDVHAPGGTIRALLPPVSVAGREARMGDVPTLGQHNDAIREELGLRIEA